jgi:hypothetical protein
VERATKGDWEAPVDYGAVSKKGFRSNNLCGYRGPIVSDICTLDDGEYVTNPNAIGDADFIAHARQDIPALLEVAKALKRVHEHAKYTLEHSVSTSQEYLLAGWVLGNVEAALTKLEAME